jgi:hypothetical protein
MGFRRWIMYLLLVTVPVVALGLILRSSQGPYTFGCQARHDGFAILVTSLDSGATSAYAIPFGECPDRILGMGQSGSREMALVMRAPRLRSTRIAAATTSTTTRAPMPTVLAIRSKTRAPSSYANTP